MKKVKVGIVGPGRLGAIHAENLAYNVPGAELTACCSLNTDELRLAEERLGVPYTYTNYSEMVSNKELDAVCIVSSSALHCSQIEEALNKGLHVFSEKPLGVSIEECEAAERAVNSHPDKVFMLGFMRRYDPAYAYAKEQISEGRIGEPFMIKATSLDPEKFVEGSIKFAATSGGILVDTTIHDIDLALWFLGADPVSVYATGGCFMHKEFAQYNDGDNVCALMKLEGDKTAMLHTGRTAIHGYHIETEIIGTKGSLRIGAEPQKHDVGIYGEQGITKECVSHFPERFREAYIIELKEFIRHIQNDTRPELTVAHAKKCTEIAYLSAKSLKTNSVVSISK